MSGITIANRIEVRGSDQVLIPGCEPTSALTTDTLSRFNTCCAATVNLDDALAAIPGSRIEWQTNNGSMSGSRKKWLVLPEYEVNCPCTPMFDSYAKLKELACEQSSESSDEYGACESLDMGFIPAKGWEDEPIPAVSPYKEERDVLGISPHLLNHPYYYQGYANFNPNLDEGTPIIL